MRASAWSLQGKWVALAAHIAWSARVPNFCPTAVVIIARIVITVIIMVRITVAIGLRAGGLES